jgi:hypothetical protein
MLNNYPAILCFDKVRSVSIIDLVRSISKMTLVPAEVQDPCKLALCFVVVMGLDNCEWVIIYVNGVRLHTTTCKEERKRVPCLFRYGKYVMVGFTAPKLR